MDEILGIIVEYRLILVVISVFLIFALIGALADRANSKRFTINTEKMRTNVTNETVQEENRTAGTAPEVQKTDVATGTEFTSAPVNANVQSTNQVAPVETKVESATASAAPVTNNAEAGQTQTI